jgi:hypothetical protein
MHIGKDEILDDLRIEEKIFTKEIVNLILIHLALILGIYFLRGYYILLFVETSETQDNWLKIISWIFLIMICVSLTKRGFKVSSQRGSFRNYQIPIITFLTFLAGRIIFLSSTYLILGAKVKYPDTPIYYFQGLMVAGLFGLLSYNRIKKFKDESQIMSFVILIIYYVGIKLIENQIT